MKFQKMITYENENISVENTTACAGEIIDLFNLLENPNNLTIEFYNYKDINQRRFDSPLETSFIDINESTSFLVKSINSEGCHSFNIIKIEVENEQYFEIDPSFLLCIDENNAIQIPIINSNGNFTYKIYKENELISVNKDQIWINEAGNYTIEAEKMDGYCPGQKQNIIVNKLRNPIISDIKTIIEDNNLLEITISSDNSENQMYSLDGITYQNANTFKNLTPGFYRAFVKNIDGCGEDSKIAILNNIPKFFSPDGNNQNDKFVVYPNIESSNLRDDIEIIEYHLELYNRYGAFIKKIEPYNNYNPEHRTWDGLFENQALPENDYWYKLEIILLDKTLNEEVTKTKVGHFSLIKK